MTLDKANRLHKILKGDLAAIVEIQEMLEEVSNESYDTGYDQGFDAGESYGKTNERAR